MRNFWQLFKSAFFNKPEKKIDPWHDYCVCGHPQVRHHHGKGKCRRVIKTSDGQPAVCPCERFRQ